VNTVQLLEQARQAIAKGDHAAAAALLEPVMQVDAGNPEALELLGSVRAEGLEAYRRGRQFDAVGRTADALAMYDKAVRLLPSDHPSARAAKERITALR
jgi:tetratricopeptide (TPR) repeat protein